MQAKSIDAYFARAQSLALINGHNPAFSEFYDRPGLRQSKIKRGIAPLREASRALAYLETLFPNSIGEACFIDRHGAENARAVKGQIAPIAELSPDETGNPFFRGLHHFVWVVSLPLPRPIPLVERDRANRRAPRNLRKT